MHTARTPTCACHTTVLASLATLPSFNHTLALPPTLNLLPSFAFPLAGTARKAFNAAVRDLVEERFGQGPLLLPMATKLFVLEKVRRTGARPTVSRPGFVVQCDE